jgi:hypothetical protein
MLESTLAYMGRTLEHILFYKLPPKNQTVAPNTPKKVTGFEANMHPHHIQSYAVL